MHKELVSTEWARRVKAILMRDVSDLGDFDAVAKMLVDLHIVMLDAPSRVKTSYDTLKEDELRQWEDLWDRRLINGQPIVIEWGSEREVALGLGSLIRAWDRLLLDCRAHLGPPADAAEWLTNGYYVIPRKTLSPWSDPKRNQGYRNRGLLRHRVIPAAIDDLEVRIVVLPTVEDDEGHPRQRFGAAVFKDFDVDVLQGQTDRFHVTGLNTQNHALDIQRQLESSSEEQCFIIVWPELTMPNTHRTKVRRILKDNLLAEEPRVYPEIVVAGSWHEMENDARYNVSHIFDRFGKLVTTYRKAVAFSDNHHGVEDIELGNEFPIIVTDQAIIAFGVCKDFCTVSRSKNPYHESKVDYVVVPSMGRIPLMQEHKTAANDLRNVTGGRVFVVQQHLPRDDGAAAFVLPPNRAKESDAIPLENGTIWQSFGWA
ncbi:hypothetical protein MUU53_20235 [Rhizobium lemnae]|uniref:CN hydrolase domain-containing protein n=1 Tax=Rhizobium lemnae TaxID=1214924 RepID=A0ABV8E6S7_9HYPH|nr:hypothetical protein [Rhizobium lemnae]MCJ8510218.1 hypothetical protein [Rhizobium lemnae]